ncbi:MAG: hypothetical protein IKO89_02510, partial [Bacteroidales bacterium]|nr:hypothetical protein [Bacteroidales bacterium]
MKAFFTLSNTGRRSRLALLPLFMGILLCIGVGQKAWGQTLLTQNFENISSISTSYSSTGWYAYNAGNGNNWEITDEMSNSGSYCVSYSYNSSYSANCYLVSAPFNVSANMTSLNVSLQEMTYYYDSYPERFEVFFVKASDFSTAAGVVSATHYNAIASATYTNEDFAQVSGSNTSSALAGQSVRLVVHCTSNADMYMLFIDDITVTESTPGGSTTVACTPTFSDPSDDYISAFSTSGGNTNINNSTSYTSSGYSNYYNSYSASIAAGQTLTCTVIPSSSSWEYGHAIWVDWNNDGSFTSAERVAYSSAVATGTWSSSFTVPSSTPAGNYRMRVLQEYYTASPEAPCVSASYGEAEDYMLTVTSGGGSPTVTCTPTFSDPSDDYISTFSTSGGNTNINNSTSYSSSGYSNYYNNYSASIAAGQTLTCTVIPSSSSWEYGHAIWVDWNNDGSFTSAERVAYSSATATGTWSSSFTVPSSTPAGNYRMRVLQEYYTASPEDPCVSASFGEGEDYMLTVTSGGTAPVTTECEQIGQGTGTTYYFPIDNYFNYSCTEQIYLASEVGDAGTITSIKFYYNYGTSYTCSNVTMYMKNVSRSSFASTTDYEPLSASDIVWTGSIAPTSAGWYTFTLNTPFEYDGTSNLLVAFYDGTSGYPGTSYTWRQTTSPNSANMALRYYSDSSNPDPYNLGSYSGSKQTYTYRANMEVCVQRISVPTSTLTTSVSPAETGTITFDPDPTYSGNRYETGTEVELTATPEEGYTFSSWSIDGIATSISTPTITLTMDEDHSVVANFAPLAYTVSVSADPAEYGTVTGGGSYDYGTSCTVTAAPSNATYRFVNWTQNGNVVSTDANYTFTVPAHDCSLVANFVLTPYTLTTSANPNAGGTVTHHSITDPTSNANEMVEIVDPSSTVQQVAFPVNFIWAYTENQMILHADEIGQAGAITSLSYQRYSEGSGSPVTRNINIYMKHTTMSAYSTTADWVAVGPADLVYSGNYTFQTSDREWQAIELNTPFNYNGTDNLLICIDDNTGTTDTRIYWWCRNTSDNRGIRAWGSSNFDPTVAGTPSGGSSLVGTFVPNMVIGFAGGGGTGYASNEYAPNDEVEITATPNYGYTFADWTVDGTAAGSDNPTTLIMDDDHTVVANFDPIPYTVSVSSTPAEYSTVSGDGIYNYGTSCTVTASTTVDCYQFVNWTLNGTVVSTQPNYTFTVTSDCALVAHFAIPAPASLTVSNITGSSADVSWTGNAESYDLICYPTNNPTETVYSDDFSTNTISPNFNNNISSYPWVISSTNPHSGSYCMASGNNGVNSTTSDISMTYTFDVPGVIEFYSRVSSEENWDYGRFFIDGTQQYQESGAGSWTLRSYHVTAGTHTFLWRFYKDSSNGHNDDRYYVDDINIKFEIPTDPIVVYDATSPYTICGLDPNTSYEVQVHGICVGENGPNVTRTFTTNNTAIPFSAGTITEGTYAPCGDITESQTINSLIETAEVEVELTEPITIGSGTNTNSYLPTYEFYNYSLTQQIYTAAEILNAGGIAGSIHSVAFQLSASNTTTRSCAIYMKHTNKTSFSGSSDWESISAADQVYNGTVSYSSADNNLWVTITLDEPFEYNGTSNLLICVDDNTGSYVSSVSKKVDAVTSAAIRIYSDGTNYNALSPTSYSGTVLNYRNNIQLGFTGTATITTTLFDGTATGNGVEYQWKLDNEPIEGATSDSYTVTVAEMEGLTPSLHTYTRWVKDACNDWAQSEGEYILDLRVPGNPEITEIPTDLLCGDQATLNVSSENSSNMQLMYFWYNEYPISNNIQPIAHSEDQYITQPLSLGTNTLYVQAVSYRVENDIDTIWQCTSEPTEVTLTAAPFEAAATAEIMPNTCGNFFTLQIEGNPTPNHTYVWYSDADCTHEVGRGYSYTLGDRQTETATYYLREYAWEVEGGTYLCQSSNTNSVVVTVLPLEAPSTLNDTYEICKGQPLNIEAFGEANDEQGLLDPYIVWFTSSDATEWIDTTASGSPLSRQIADVSTTLYAATASYIDSYSGPMHLSAPAATQTNYGNAVYFDITAGNSPIVLDSIDLHVRSGQGTGVQQQVYVYNGSIENVNPIDPNIWGLRNTTMDYDGGEHAIIHFSDPISLEPNETISLLINTSNAMQLYYNMESQIQLGDVLASNNFMTIHKGYGFQYTSDFQIGFPSAYPNPLSFCGTIHFDVEGELHFGCMSEDRTAVAVIVDSLPQVGTFDDPDPLCNGDNLTEEVLEELLPEIIWNTISDNADSRIEVWMVSVNDEEPELLTDDMVFYYGNDYTLIRKAINNCGENQSEAHITVYAPPAFTEEVDIPEELCANTPIELDMPMSDETGTDEETWWEYTGVEEEDYQELDTESGIPAIGQYYIRARIENTCGGNATDPVLVEVRDLPAIAPVEVTEIATCFGQAISPEAPEVEYNLSQGTATWVLVQDDQTADPVELTFPQTADMSWDGVRICYAATNDCGTTYADTLTLTVHPDLALTVSHDLTAPYICPAVGVELTASTPVADATFEWSNDDEGGLVSTTGNPVAAKNGSEDVNHYYTVVATDGFGCRDTATTTVAVVFHNDLVYDTVEICELELPYTYVYGDQDTTL